MFDDYLRSPTPPRHAYTVSQLNREIREILEAGYSGISVEAEVVEAARAASGHVYFTLADSGGSAQLRAVMWRGQAMRYGSRIAVGKSVRCVGRVTLYEARGSYQMVVESVAEAGAGEKARRLAELKQKLLEEGLFAADRKRPLPASPECVGVVTSRQGAALQDIIKVSSRRFPIRLVLAHAQVQGETAPSDIVQALERLAGLSEVEVVIVGRGGGSSEDLDAFNSEAVVRKVAAHPVPVISAVGHEVDLTFVDLVADCRAATPSEAAELAVPDGRALEERLAQGSDALLGAVERQVQDKRSRLDGWSGRLRAQDPRVRLTKGIEVLTRCREALVRWPELTLQRARSDLAALETALAHWPGPALERARHKLGRSTLKLEALSPLASLARGYAVVRRQEDGTIVRSHRQAPFGTGLHIALAEGRLECKVERSEPPK